jgi:hypothetical protein
MGNRCTLLIKAEEIPSSFRRENYDGAQHLDVRDLSTRETGLVRAQDISPYRHTLFRDGRAFKILDVVKSTQ